MSRKSVDDPKTKAKSYFCVRTSASADGKICLHCDSVQFIANGSIAFWQDDELVLALAANRWSALWKASVSDGRPYTIEEWKGELTDEPVD
jgi:hypothetical protein